VLSVVGLVPACIVFGAGWMRSEFARTCQLVAEECVRSGCYPPTAMAVPNLLM